MRPRVLSSISSVHGQVSPHRPGIVPAYQDFSPTPTLSQCAPIPNVTVPVNDKPTHAFTNAISFSKVEASVQGKNCNSGVKTEAITWRYWSYRAFAISVYYKGHPVGALGFDFYSVHWLVRRDGHRWEKWSSARKYCKLSPTLTFSFLRCSLIFPPC